MQTETVMDVVLLPGILMLFGVAIFFGSIQAERTYGVKNKWQWTCLIPFVLAAIVGTQQIWPLWTDVTYNWKIHTYRLRKIELGLYVSFLLPYILGAGASYFTFGKRKPKSARA